MLPFMTRTEYKDGSYVTAFYQFENQAVTHMKYELEWENTVESAVYEIKESYKQGEI